MKGTHIYGCAIFGTTLFGLCESKYSFVWNFIVYTVQNTFFDDSTENGPYSLRQSRIHGSP
jgi:hypothetical protein